MAAAGSVVSAVVALVRQRIGGGNAALAVAARWQGRLRDRGGSAITGPRGGGGSSGGVSAAAEVALATRTHKQQSNR